MQAIRKIDNWLIGTGEGTAADRLYLYGTYGLTGVIFFATLIGLN